MLQTQEEISKRIRDSLKLQDPEISLEPGTPERRMVDAFAQSVAELNVNTFVQSYQYDIDTRYGQDLDDFLGLFGFARQTAKRAYGTVTFSRGTPAPAPVLIPVGTQVSFPGNAVAPSVIFQTVGDAIIPENGLSVDISVEAVSPGDQGNVPAFTITSLIAADVNNVSGVINNTATSGGTSDESDEAFRVRFKNTVFRNIAGTPDQFLALAIASAFTDRAIVIGPISRFSEYVQIPSNGIVLSGNPHAKYIYPYDYFLTEDGTEDSEIYYDEVDYYFNVTDNRPELEIAPVIFEAPTTPPTATIHGDPGNVRGTVVWGYTYLYNHVTIDGVSVQGESAISPESDPLTFSTGGKANLTIPIGGGSVVGRNIYRFVEGRWYQVGTINDNVTTAFQDNSLGLGDEPPKQSLQEDAVVFLEHGYLSSSSRNVYTDDLQVLNKVDVYISGEDIQEGRDVVMGPSSTNNFVNDDTSKYHYASFVRDHDGSNPVLGNRLLPLLWTPVADLQSTITVGSATYTKNQDYFLVKDVTNLKESFRCRDGIELTSNMALALAGSRFVIDYTFNRLPIVTNQVINQHRQVGQDVLVHSAKKRYFNVNLVIMYADGFQKASVDTDIKSALTIFFAAQNFGAVIQLSDIVQIVHGVNGVDNVRLAIAGDDDDNSNNYGIQEVNIDGELLAQTPFTNDFFLGDTELAVFNNLGPTVSGPLRKSQNTWTTGF